MSITVHTFPEGYLPSNDRPAGIEVDTVILHATAGASLRSSYLYLRGLKSNQASYHAGADRDGTVYKMVPLSKRAWHAGVCFRGIGRDSKDVNSYSLGFAFANRNDGERVTEDQREAARAWILTAKAQYPGLKYLTDHMGVAYPRKSDANGITVQEMMDMAQECGLAYVRGLRP